MKQYQIVIDTNVFFSALRSKKGTSYKLLSLIDGGKFKVNVSVPLLFEYEDVAKRSSSALPLSYAEIDNILDYLCAVANRHKIFFLWRPKRISKTQRMISFWSWRLKRGAITSSPITKKILEVLKNSASRF